MISLKEPCRSFSSIVTPIRSFLSSKKLWSCSREQISDSTTRPLPDAPAISGDRISERGDRRERWQQAQPCARGKIPAADGMSELPSKKPGALGQNRKMPQPVAFEQHFGA